jgi:XTP/dITP diphosphohydrolase
MQTIFLATNNVGKVREFQALLFELAPYLTNQIELILPAELGIHLEVDETGKSYAENAALKAVAYAKASGKITLADDSGLEVLALDGVPGIHSARFSPQLRATDSDRRIYLLSKLETIPPPWKARFVCTIAIVDPTGGFKLRIDYVTGECWGEIIASDRGTNGFGYDPIFYLPELGKTMAELSMDEKNQVSHRANAMRAALPILLSLL